MTVKKDYRAENFIIEQACDKIEEMLVSLGIFDFTRHRKMIATACPIHNGDNISAFNLYPDGDEVRGHWVCRTKGCEKKYGRDLIGFIKGVLSNKEDKECSWKEARDWLLNFLGYESIKDIDVKSINSSMSRNSITVNMRRIEPKDRNYQKMFARGEIRRKLVFPCRYYIDRNYSEEILDKYDVGYSHKLRRAVVPFYEDSHKYCIGWTMRSIYEKHEPCGMYHDTLDKCPSTKVEKLNCAKWLTDNLCNNHDCLYNYWYAQDYIRESKTVILVEGPGDVWRLEENGIHNSLAILGTTLQDTHISTIGSCGVLSVILLLDNDKAGKAAKKTIKKQLERLYNVFIPSYSSEDVGDNKSIEEIRKEIERKVG
jgi:5S rRNA maturation endonuclease (ribonuclease M5)